MITHIQLVTIPVKDQDRALAFYTGKLGWEVVMDEDFGMDQRWLQLRIPGAETQVVLFTAPGQEDRIGTFSNICFAADDVRKTYEQLHAKGVDFVEPPKEQPWGGTQAIFQDVDGNRFVIHS